MSRLHDRWCEALAPLGVESAAAGAAFADLIARYGEPGRHYHTVEHLAAVVDSLHGCRQEANDLATLLLAAFWHDVIYDPRRSDNEECSVAYAAAALDGLGVPATVIDRVQALILKTKRHEADVADTDACLLLDADLAILGAAEGDYDRYARKIRQEYEWVPEEAYRAGRAAVLQQFLRRERIFRTRQFACLEESARRNLAREIASLTASETRQK